MDGLIVAGHSCEVADLHLENFDPKWSMEDIAADQGNLLPADVLKEQSRIDKCDAICMVFPLFWFGMPAMMKGWLERVWSWGWAYDQLDDHNKSLQKSRTAVMLIPAGANPETWEPHAEIEKSMINIWETGTLGYFGFTDKRTHFLYGSTGSEQRRNGILRRAYEVGLNLDAKPQ